MENPFKMDDLGVPLFLETSMVNVQCHLKFASLNHSFQLLHLHHASTTSLMTIYEKSSVHKMGPYYLYSYKYRVVTPYKWPLQMV